MSQAAVASKSAVAAHGGRVPGLLRWSPVAWVGLLGAVAALGGARAWLAAMAGSHLHAPRWELLAHAKPLIQVHLAGAVTALLVGTVLLAGVKGTALHRALGWTWVVAMAAVALSSAFITESHPGRWSLLHVFTGWTLIALPMAVAAVRRRNIALHRRLMTGLFVGGLALNSFVAFLPGRLLWRVVFG